MPLWGERKVLSGGHGPDNRANQSIGWFKSGDVRNLEE